MWLVNINDENTPWLSVWSEVETVRVWSSRCHYHPKTPSSLSLASRKSRMVLPFWYQLTKVVLKRDREMDVRFKALIEHTMLSLGMTE